MRRFLGSALAAAAALTLAGAPALAQLNFSNSYTFLKAVKERDGDKVAKARVKGSYLTRVLPALVGIIVIFAAFTKRFQTSWVLAAGVGFIGFWTLLRLTGMAIEWRAVARGTEVLKATRALKRIDDEEEVIRCAKASVWNTVWPF